MTLRKTWGTLGLTLALVSGGAAGVANAQAPTTAAPGAPPAAVPVPSAGSAAAPQPAAAPPAPGGAVPAAATAAPAEPGTAPAPAAAPAAALPAADQGNYQIRLKSLERNVNELKEQVFRTKARLSQLKETVLGGVIGASRGIIKFKNEAGGSFQLVKASCALDGVQIFSKADDSGRLGEMKEFDIYNGAIQPGSHTVIIKLVYKGNGYGVFSYMKGYTYTVQSSQTFVAGEGKATSVTAVGFEKGGITTNQEDKLAVDFRVNLMAPEGSGTAKK